MRKRQIKRVETPYGEFLVILTHRQLLLLPEISLNGTCRGQWTTELMTTIKKMPNQSSLQKIITTHVQQRMMIKSHQSLYPSISIGVTLPCQHPIWEIIDAHDFTGLISLLNEGKASLRSYDENGSALLHVRPRTFPV